MADVDRERLFNHALEADDLEYARELAVPNGYKVILDTATGGITTRPAILSEAELADIKARERRERLSPDLSRHSGLPAFMDCVDKRSLPFWE